MVEDECEEAETCVICQEEEDGLVSDCGICSAKFCKSCLFQHQDASPAARGESKRVEDENGIITWVPHQFECAGCRSVSLWKRRGDTVVRIGKSKTKRAPPATVQCGSLLWRDGSRGRCDKRCKVIAGADADSHYCGTHLKQQNTRGNVLEDPAVRYCPTQKRHFYNGTIAGTATQDHTNNDWFRVIHHDGNPVTAPDIMIIQGFFGEDAGTGFATDEMKELGGDEGEPFAQGDFLSKYAFLQKCYPNANWLTLKGKLGGRDTRLKAIFEELNLTVGRPTHEWCLAHTDKL